MPDIFDILKATVRLGASDLHLVIGEPPMVRRNGALKPISGAAAITAEKCRQMIYSVLLEEQRARFEEHWDLDCSIELPGVSRFRVNVFLQRDGVAAVFHAISADIPTPEQIGLTSAMTRLIDLPRGLVLVTGPTGSGKTTTLASLVELINQKHHKHILTIEDPIEFSFKNKNSIIMQREVGRQTKGFGQALRHAVRQNPDVILIGEMRDLETMSLALAAAETGHLCLGTMHTKDAPSTVDRIINVFPPHQQQQVRLQLASVLEAVICQTLVKRKDGQGRLCAREFMRSTTGIASLIREGKTHLIYGAIEAGGKLGMISRDQHLASLVTQGLVASEDACAVARSPSTVRQLAGMAARSADEA